MPEDDEENGRHANENLIEVIGAINTEEGENEQEESAPAIFGVFDDLPEVMEKEPELNENNIIEENNNENIAESSNDNLISVPFGQTETCLLYTSRCV